METWREQANRPRIRLSDAKKDALVAERTEGVNDALRMCADKLAAWLPAHDAKVQKEALKVCLGHITLEHACDLITDEANWWHARLHRATGIPCDGTMEECKRAAIRATVSDVPALPMKHCTTCNGPMVWQNIQYRVVMCPNCVMERCEKAEMELQNRKGRNLAARDAKTREAALEEAAKFCATYSCQTLQYVPLGLPDAIRALRAKGQPAAKEGER